MSITGGKKKRSHRIITFEERLRLIDHINRTENFRFSARTLGISESTAKTIYYKYMKTGEIARKTEPQKRKIPRKSRHTKNPKEESATGHDSDKKIEVVSAEELDFEGKESIRAQTTEPVTI